jgi:hypothetical protein
LASLIDPIIVFAALSLHFVDYMMCFSVHDNSLVPIAIITTLDLVVVLTKSPPVHKKRLFGRVFDPFGLLVSQLILSADFDLNFEQQQIAAQYEITALTQNCKSDTDKRVQSIVGKSISYKKE